MYQSPFVSDPNSFEGKKFRRRFRVDYETFRDVLVPLCEEKPIFNCIRTSRIPVEFKIMIGLRILGRDHDCDTVSELAGVGESTCNTIFKQFVENFSTHYCNDFVKFPEGEELTSSMRGQRRLSDIGMASSG